MLPDIGAGKTLVLEVCAKIDKQRNDGKAATTLLILPTNALQEEMKKRLQNHGFRVGIMWGKLGERDAVSRLKQMQLDFAITTATALVGGDPTRCRTLMGCNALCRVCVDEVHGMSEQGFDFKEEYQKLAQIKELSPYLQVVAMSATLTPAAALDVVKHLNLELSMKQNWVRGQIARPELTFEVVKGGEYNKQTNDLIAQTMQQASKGTHFTSSDVCM